MSKNDKTHRLKPSKVVILTGAGISAESGVKTFRDNNGLWENHAIDEVATPEAFERNPKLVQRFYNDRRKQLFEVKPNTAHKALADFEKEFQGEFLLVTQNVDDLHERGGSENLIHMHGELLKSRCTTTGQIHTQESDINQQSLCQCCGTPTLRPHIVWFGEIPLMMEKIYQVLEDCDLFISIGTSGNVYPAAGFVQVAKESNATTVEINLEPSSGASLFDHAILGRASIEVPKYIRGLTSTTSNSTIF